MLNYRTLNRLVIVLLVVLIGLIVFTGLTFWWIALLLFFWISITAYGSYQIRMNYFLPALHKNEVVAKKIVALTFDDGPDERFTEQVLNLLDLHHQKASFFCIGQKVEKHPDLARKIVKEGHLIANHSYAHQHSFGFLPASDVTESIRLTKDIIQSVTGFRPRFFRPPFGVTNPNIAKAVKKMNLITFGWSIRSFDTVAKDPDRVFRKIVKKIEKGDVILMHDTSELSVAVLEKLLRYFEEKEIESVRLDHLFNLKAYE